MLTFLSPYKLFIEIGLLITVVLAAVVGVHKFLDYEQSLGYDRAVAEYNAKLIAAEEKANIETAALNKQLEDANNAATKREQTAQAAANIAAASNASLRDALGRVRSGLPGASPTALANTVTTLTNLFGECSSRYQSLGAIADRWANDAKRLQDSWPKVKN